MHWQEILLRMVTAMVMGMLIGLDRERHGKPAGIKTFALVSLGAATFTLISIQMVEMTPDNLPQGYDPVRLVAGIVGGIGFLGAGTILQSRGHVEGVTTAAGIWIVGAIGVACGAGFYLIASMAFAGVLLVWLPLSYVQKIFFKEDCSEARDSDRVVPQKHPDDEEPKRVKPPSAPTP